MRVFVALVALAVVATSAVAQELYRIRPGDRIGVTIAQEPDLDRQVIVRPDGNISFPLAGDFRVEGLTLEALGDRLGERLKDFYQTELDITASLASTAAPERDTRPEAAGFRCLDSFEFVEEGLLTEERRDVIAQGLLVESTRRDTTSRRTVNCTHWQRIFNGS